MRCKSCNSILSDAVLSTKRPDGVMEDLCGRCRVLVILDVEGVFQDREYAHADVTERISSGNSSNLYVKMSD